MRNALNSSSSRRKSRFHDEKGNLVSAGRLLRNGPRAVLTSVARRAFHFREARPWISYDAQALIAGHLKTSSAVCEFGSGVSTIWYAERSRYVVSVEDSPEWFETVRRMIQRRGLENVDLVLETNPERYVSAPARSRVREFDLIVVDGRYRKRCCEAALPLLKPSGMIYLDNSDKSAGGRSGHVPEAQRVLLEFAKHDKASVRFFTDFSPTQAFVQQGLLIQRPV